jgi:type I restriction enzyme S subunit
MGSEYPSIVLGEVAAIIMGQSPPGTTYNETGKGLPFYQGVTDFGSRYPSRRVFCTSPTRIAKQGDILLSVRAPIGQVNVASEECAIGRGLAIIRPHNPQNRIFIEFVLRAKQSVWHTLEGGGSVFGNAKRNDLECLEIVWPEEKIRYSVSSILGALDDKIELNHQMNRTLEEMAQAIFKSWFVDFEFPNDEGQPYKSSGGEMGYSEELQREIPKGWVAKPIDEIANFLNGLALQKYPPKDESYLPVIKIRELRQGITESSDKASPDIDKRYIVDDGDILFSWSGSLEVCIWCGGKGALNQHLFKVTSQTYLKWFCYQWIKFYLPKFQHIAKGKATTMGHIQRHHLSETYVLIPPKEINEIMNEIMNSLIEKFINNNLESRQLVNLRDALLPKLLSGEIRVNNLSSNRNAQKEAPA